MFGMRSQVWVMVMNYLEGASLSSQHPHLSNHYHGILTSIQRHADRWRAFDISINRFQIARLITGSEAFQSICSPSPLTFQIALFIRATRMFHNHIKPIMRLVSIWVYVIEMRAYPIYHPENDRNKSESGLFFGIARVICVDLYVTYEFLSNWAYVLYVLVIQSNLHDQIDTSIWRLSAMKGYKPKWCIRLRDSSISWGSRAWLIATRRWGRWGWRRRTRIPVVRRWIAASYSISIWIDIGIRLLKSSN